MEPGFYNMDCMDAMRQFPDKFFDLAVVDPPYGDAGGIGNQDNDLAAHSTDTKRWNRFGQRFDRYKTPAGDIANRGNRGNLGGVNTAKKSLPGIRPRKRHTLTSFFVYPRRRLYGAETILICHPRAAF